MKKSNFVALIMGSVSGVFFALGMCMATLPEWNAFRPGIIMGCFGMVIALVTVFVWRRMEHKEPIRITVKAVAATIVAIIGTLCLGIGMCMTMVWAQLVTGIIVGVVGIAVLLMLIPVCKGIK
ncbi:MAG: hypothetical protein PHE02_03860 [Lachnospiraceae bacterium]|nr:hypothetical protein [Lachnospiraceae bacterium]